MSVWKQPSFFDWIYPFGKMSAKFPMLSLDHSPTLSRLTLRPFLRIIHWVLRNGNRFCWIWDKTTSTIRLNRVGRGSLLDDPLVITRLCWYEVGKTYTSYLHIYIIPVYRWALGWETTDLIHIHSVLLPHGYIQAHILTSLSYITVRSWILTIW